MQRKRSDFHDGDSERDRERERETAQQKKKHEKKKKKKREKESRLRTLKRGAGELAQGLTQCPTKEIYRRNKTKKERKKDNPP